MPYPYLIIVTIVVLLAGLFFLRRQTSPVEIIDIEHHSKNLKKDPLPPEVRANKIYYRGLVKKKKSRQVFSLANHSIKTTRELTTAQKEFLYQELKRFPLPSGAAMQLAEMLRDPYVDSRKVAALASTDPIISGRLLALVNSAYFRPSSGKKIHSIHRAILYLGFNQVRNLLFQLMLEQAVNKHSPLPQEEIRKIWLHSAAVSVAAGEIAKKFEDHPGLLLTAGLMHDVGKFFLPYFENNELGGYALNGAEQEPPPLIQEEQKTGFNHAVIGAVLCYIWQLPEEISQAVSLHHFGDFSRLKKIHPKMQRVITTVAVADYICHLLGHAEEEPFLYEIPKEALEACGFPSYPEFLITPALEKEVERMVKLLEEYTTD